MKNPYQSALLYSVAILMVLYLPWDRKFEFMGEHLDTTIKFYGYAWLWAPPLPEVVGHPAYSVVPDWVRLAGELLVLGCLVLGGKRLMEAKLLETKLAALKSGESELKSRVDDERETQG